MKKIFFAAVILFLSVVFRTSFAANGTCGDNVKYETEGSTITFSKEDPAKDAVWDRDCGKVFQYDQMITVVKVSEKITVLDGSYLFYDFPYVREMYLSNFDVSRATNMESCFESLTDVYTGQDLTSLTTLDLHGWDTSKVVNFRKMFASNIELTNLDLSDWVTGSAEDMSYMFYFCESLSALDVSKWNTSNARNISSMFHYCTSLTPLDVSGWNTSNVTDMSGLFFMCSSLTFLDISKWDTSNVTDMRAVFEECSSLTSLDVSHWDTSKVTDMGAVFDGCSSLTSLDVSKWNTSNVTDMGAVFEECSSLTSLDVSHWDTSKVEDMYQMFSLCSSLETLDVSNWNTSAVKDMSSMFFACHSLKTLDVSKWDTANVTMMINMFIDCSGLTMLDVSKWDTSKVTNMSVMFSGCFSLKELDLSKWDTSNVNEMEGMFRSLQIKKIKLGEKFQFKNNDKTFDKMIIGSGFYTIIPAPDTEYTGNWINEEKDLVRTRMELQTGYDGSSMSGTWVWEKRTQTLELTAMNSEKTYNGKPLVSEASATIKEGTTITFSTDNGGTWSPEPPSITDAGMLSYLAKAENPSYPESVTGEGTLTIHPKSLEDKSISLRLDPAKVNYDGREHEVTYSVYDAERETELIEGYDYEIVQNSSALKGTDPGTYKVIISADDKVSRETEKFVTGFNYIGMRSAVWEIIGTSIHMYRLDFPRDLCDRCSLPATGILSAASAAISDMPQDISYNKSGLTVQIPSLSVEAEIVTVPFTENEWPVNGLGARAGLLEGSAFPGEGYSIIAGHNTLNRDEVGPFGGLAAMKENDKIFVNGSRGNTLRYSVYANELIEPDDFGTIADIAEQNPGSLILVTCENESLDGTYLNRRVIFAEPL